MDLRQLVLPERTEIRCLRLASADVTGAVLRQVWVERGTFTEVILDRALLADAAEHGNTFIQCSFSATDFRTAAFGYKGSRFIRCTFSGTIFGRTACVRPEFDKCLFDTCRFSGLDFNGASFQECEFRGDVRAVWFRGKFPVPDYVERYGQPRPNMMKSVSFREARLFDVTFSNECDLSTVMIPQDGKHGLFDRWPERLEKVLEEARRWPEPYRKVGEAFCTSSLVHAKSQFWYLLNIDDLIEEFGRDCATKLWNALNIA